MISQAALMSFGVDVLRLGLWLVLLAAIFVPLERLFALHPSKVFRKAVWADLGYYFLSSLLPGIILSIPLAFLAATAQRLMPEGVYTAVATAPLWVRVPAALVIGEIGAYWGHRWTHEVPFLWRFHEVHHEAEHMDWLVNTRAHPVDMVFTRLCTLAPLYIFGLGGPAGSGGSLVPALMIIIGVVWGFFIHANVRWRFGRAEIVIATPAFHHWHHTMSGAINRNYAPMFPVLDKLFGTLHLPHDQWPEEYGVLTPEQAREQVQANRAAALRAPAI
ncbi:MAG: sterol desaturase family protein [Janthinobacterium lividum]